MSEENKAVALSLLKKLFLLPGYAILAINYYFPKGGIVGVAESGRQWRERDQFAWYWGFGFWFLFTLAMFALYG
jgi:hypothetical protein